MKDYLLHIKISKRHLVILITFLIYPFASLPLIITEIYNRNYYALYYLAIFMGLLSYLWIPSGDLYRYQMDYEVIKNINFSDLKNLLALDFIYPWIMLIYGKIGLNFELLRFTICSFCYILYFRIFVSIIKANDYLNESYLLSFCAFLIMFFLLRFSGFLTGVRFTFAMGICFYAVYSIIYNDKKSGWILLIISAFIHFSFWAIFLIVFIVKIFKPKIYKSHLLTLMVCGYILSTFFIEYFINLLPIDDVLKIHLANYTSGYYAQEEYASRPIGFRLSFLASYFALYPGLLLILYKLKEYSLFSVFVGICILLSFMFNMNSSYSRYAFLGVIFFTIPFLLQYKTIFTKTHLYFFLCLSFIVYSASIYTVKRELSCGHQYKILYSPLPTILMSTYDINWVNANILTNGDMRKSN